MSEATVKAHTLLTCVQTRTRVHMPDHVCACKHTKQTCVWACMHKYTKHVLGCVCVHAHERKRVLVCAQMTVCVCMKRVGAHACGHRDVCMDAHAHTKHTPSGAHMCAHMKHACSCVRAHQDAHMDAQTWIQRSHVDTMVQPPRQGCTGASGHPHPHRRCPALPSPPARAHKPPPARVGVAASVLCPPLLRKRGHRARVCTVGSVPSWNHLFVVGKSPPLWPLSFTF